MLKFIIILIVAWFVGVWGWSQIIGSIQNLSTRKSLLFPLILWVVIMSAGAFTLGSSIELSADAPLREPYAVWLQGGLNFHSAKIAVMFAAQEVLKANGIED